MNAVFVYLMASSWVFLVGWVVLLLVAYVWPSRAIRPSGFLAAGDLAREHWQDR